MPIRRDASPPLAPPAPMPAPRVTRTDLILNGIWLTLLVVGVVLGLSRTGHPLVPRARELFVPAGVVLLVVAWRWRRRQPIPAAGFALLALGLIGVGAHEATSGPWTLLAVPGAVVGCLATLRSAVRGPGDWFFDRMRWSRAARRRRRARTVAMTRCWLVFTALLFAVGAGLAVSAALPK